VVLDPRWPKERHSATLLPWCFGHCVILTVRVRVEVVQQDNEDGLPASIGPEGEKVSGAIIGRHRESCS
jgi:hypothetical protein